ncbi:CorA family divalent cation transporter [Methanocella arvoryzae]|nr:CorA family divalent cation transporter [Methanocella arvoryzae]
MSTCVLLHHDGQVERITEKSLEEYLSLIPSASVAWVDYTSLDLDRDLEKIMATMGFTQIPPTLLQSGFFSSYEDADTELGIRMPSVTVKDFDVKVRPLIILLRDNFIMTVHDQDIVRLIKLFRYAPTFMKKITAESKVDKITLILERIIDENNDRNFEYLREIEKHGDDISRRLIDEDYNKKLIAREIYEMKHILITYIDALWASKDVIENLRYGDADLLTDDDKLLGRIGILSDNINRHIELSEQMSNVLASGLEVMQSIYNNQLQQMNNRFALVTAYLTVLGTAFLVPNTIATIVSSLGWDMAGAEWYLPFLLGSTIVATLISIFWVWHVWNSKKDDDIVRK